MGHKHKRDGSCDKKHKKASIEGTSRHLWNSKELTNLYENGKLDEMLMLFKGKISRDTLMGKGNEASVFSSDDPDQVIKVCPKSISYFKNWGHNPKQFRDKINSLMPYFAPIGNIIYDDDKVFVYTQSKCQLLSKKHIAPEIVAGFFQLVEFMFHQNLLLTDLPPQNVGLLGGYVIIFDYHGLGPFRDKHGVIHHKEWWRRLARNLTRFITHSYTPDKRKEYEDLMQDYDSNVLKILTKDERLPRSFIELLKYMGEAQSSVTNDRLCQLLRSCQDDIVQKFNLRVT